jgi:hypothetical protein
MSSKLSRIRYQSELKVVDQMSLLLSVEARPRTGPNSSSLVVTERVCLAISPAPALIISSSFVPLPKSVTRERIHSNTCLYDFSLDADDMEKLDALDQGKQGAVTWNPVDHD